MFRPTAKLFLAGKETKSTGEVRQFTTHQLAAGAEWNAVHHRAEIQRDGRTITKEQTDFPWGWSGSGHYARIRLGRRGWSSCWRRLSLSRVGQTKDGLSSYNPPTSNRRWEGSFVCRAAGGERTTEFASAMWRCGRNRKRDRSASLVA